MEDPIPENIDGSKVVTHSYEHRIDWGYVGLGVGLLAVAYVGYTVLATSESDDDERGVPST